jgi:hypothetical protein
MQVPEWRSMGEMQDWQTAPVHEAQYVGHNAHDVSAKREHEETSSIPEEQVEHEAHVPVGVRKVLLPHMYGQATPVAPSMQAQDVTPPKMVHADGLPAIAREVRAGRARRGSEGITATLVFTRLSVIREDAAGKKTAGSKVVMGLLSRETDVKATAPSNADEAMTEMRLLRRERVRSWGSPERAFTGSEARTLPSRLREEVVVGMPGGTAVSICDEQSTVIPPALSGKHKHK